MSKNKFFKIAKAKIIVNNKKIIIHSKKKLIYIIKFLKKLIIIK